MIIFKLKRNLGVPFSGRGQLTEQLKNIVRLLYMDIPYCPLFSRHFLARPFFARHLSKIGQIFERFCPAPWAKM